MTAAADILRAKLRRGLSHLPFIPKALSLACEASRGLTLAWIGLLLVQGLLPVAIVYLLRLLVDAIVGATKTGPVWHRARPALILVALLTATTLVGDLLRVVVDWVRTAQSERVKDHVSGLIHRKSVEVDLAFYEMTEYYDHLHRARDQAAYHPAIMLESVGSFFQNAITLVAMMGVLLQFGIWLPIVLLASAAPTFAVILQHLLREHRWRIESTPLERRAWYYESVLTGAEAATEIRLFALGGYFRSAFQVVRRQLSLKRIQMAREQGMAQLGAGALAVLGSGASMAWMIWRTLQGAITLGQLTLFYQAFHSGLRLVRSLLENVTKTYSSSLFIRDLIEFLDLKSHVVDPPNPAPIPLLPGSLHFEAVTFQYPGNTRVALNDFTLTIPSGQVVALVGSNGAGKTTLIKLLCRLYDPQAGCVKLNGIDIREFRVAEVRRLFTVLFQEPMRYNATVGENISIGDLIARNDAGGSMEAAQRVRIEAAARAAGADEVIAHLPDGFDAILGKSLGAGTGLSGGEWQRISLARAFLRQAPILLLDEPTSAMDSWAEVQWLRRFRALTAGRTVVVITHRFTTAMHADMIHVMSEGRIIESGTHDELLRSTGPYARSWTEQMRTIRNAGGCLGGMARRLSMHDQLPKSSGPYPDEPQRIVKR